MSCLGVAATRLIENLSQDFNTTPVMMKDVPGMTSLNANEQSTSDFVELEISGLLEFNI